MTRQPRPSHWRPVDYLALTLAAAAGTALVLLTATICILAVIKPPGAGPILGENITQVLMASVAGVLGIVGPYVGYAFGRRRGELGEEYDDSDK